MLDKWIWLPVEIYPDNQNTRFDALSGQGDESYTVAEFEKSYSFDKNIKSVNLRFSADTEFQLFCNGSLVSTGPCSVGGDFLCNGASRDWFYATETKLSDRGNSLSFFARVKMMPVQICEYSKGHGGFMLSGEVCFDDGDSISVFTDSTWRVRRNGAYKSPLCYDGTILPDKYVFAREIDDIWSCETAPIPPRSESTLTLGSIELAPYEEKTTAFPLDMIYAGFVCAECKSKGLVSLDIDVKELADEGHCITESVKFENPGEYRGFYLHSAGVIFVHSKNLSNTRAHVDVGFITTHFPVDTEAQTVTSDKEINRILSVCKHTLKYCRQTHHLDSPRHCEPLACTGDYYIESLMTVFSFGDMRLSSFDVLRTAELLRHNDGRMFHTTYSLIWVRMLYDTYLFSGDISLLEKCIDALGLLLNRFDTYIGENGLIENPPDYMFVDWIYIDGLSMHHPPKCLGQTVLNMFYYMALTFSEKIYSALGKSFDAKVCEEKGITLKRAINDLLYDKEKGMYFEGLDTPTDESMLYEWLGQNPQRRYYLKHSNIMAAYTSVCEGDRARMLIDKIMSGEIEGDVQPYFMHYLLEAVFTHGMREKYTLKIIEKWKEAVADCPKGLAEGFVAPEPTYRFDHSHAWGGTPLWSLPKALLGLRVDEAAFRKITLCPSLLGLSGARVELPTPYGPVVCEMEEGSKVRISAPDGIEVRINERD